MLNLVTFFIPSYNHVNFVSDCIRSIIDQDYSRIELLIIDDGSTDGSVEAIQQICLECEDRFERFAFISQENRGLVPNMNFALNWARGEFFVPIASDDAIFPNKTSTLLDCFEGEHLAGVTGGYVEVDEFNNNVRTVIPNAGIWNFEDVLTRRARLFAPTAMFRTSALRSVGGYWENIPIEDRAMWLKLTHSGYSVKTTNHVVAYYRRHTENLSKSTIKMTEARMSIYDQFEPHPILPKIRSTDFYGAAREFAARDVNVALSYLRLGFQSSHSSIFSKAFFRALKKIIINLY